LSDPYSAPHRKHKADTPFLTFLAVVCDSQRLLVASGGWRLMLEISGGLIQRMFHLCNWVRHGGVAK
jgi:hypothetical protein